MAARLAGISGKQAVHAFERGGWQKIGQVGSHVGFPGQECESISPFLNTVSSPLEHCEHSFAVPD